MNAAALVSTGARQRPLAEGELRVVIEASLWRTVAGAALRAESAIGRIVQMGPNVEGPAIGDRVFCLGGRARFEIHKLRGPAMERAVPLPEGASTKHALAVRAVLRALRVQNAFRPRHRGAVVVVGLGLIGNLIAQLQLLAGRRVFGLSRQPEQVQIARDFGLTADCCPDLRRPPEEISGRPVGRIDLVIAADEEAWCLESSLALCPPHAQVLFLEPPQRVELDAVEFLRKIHFRCARLRGLSEWGPGQPEQAPEGPSLAAALALLDRGTLRLPAIPRIPSGLPWLPGRALPPLGLMVEWPRWRTH